MVQFVVSRKTLSHFSFDVNGLPSASEPFVFSGCSVTWRFFSTFYPKEKPLSLLINLFIPMLNEYLWISCCARRKEPSVNFTNINKKWFLPLGSSKGKREARGDEC